MDEICQTDTRAAAVIIPGFRKIAVDSPACHTVPIYENPYNDKRLAVIADPVLEGIFHKRDKHERCYHHARYALLQLHFHSHMSRQTDTHQFYILLYKVQLVLQRYLRIVCYKYYGPSFSMKPLEQDQHLETGPGVEVSCRLVSQNHGRIVDQSPGNGHPLHLTAGHLVALVPQAVSQPYCLESTDRLLTALCGRIGRIVHEGQFHILYSCSLGQKVVVLEHKPYLAVAERRPPVFIHCPYGYAIEPIVSGSRGIQTAESVEQGGLVRAGYHQV